jgi:SAM-dependent methyltransferase
LDEKVASWLNALEERHLSDLTTSEVARALRALSSCYVERRAKLAEGDALATKGKRAAFAVFYGPLHFLVTQRIVRSIPSAMGGIRDVLDLGCGTGAAGAAWGIETGAETVKGYDRHPWAVTEASWTYRHFRLHGRAIQRDIARTRINVAPVTAIVVAYAINELSPEVRSTVLQELLDAHGRGARILVIEPIARRLSPWWDAWRASFQQSGGRADDWRFALELPPTQRTFARAAGLNPRELTARSLWLDRPAAKPS